MSSSSKIAVYNLSDLKNTTDDALPNYLTSLNFHQSHTHTDIRLALGYTAVTIAALAFYFDYKLGFEATKYWTLVAVVLYFALNGAYTWWIWMVERGLVFEGVRDGTKIQLSSHTKKQVPVYNLTARITSIKGPSPTKTIQLRTPFTRFFTSDGEFVAKPFQQWLASEVPVIGQADPNNVVEEIGRGNSGNKSVLRNVEPAEAISLLAEMRQGGQGAGSTPRSRKKA